jgi:hypothetical protein
VGDVIRNRRLAIPYAPTSLAEKRSHLDELRTQAMFSDSDLLSRRIRDLEAQIEHESGYRAGERRDVMPDRRAVRPGPRPVARGSQALRGPLGKTGGPELS